MFSYSKKQSDLLGIEARTTCQMQKIKSALSLLLLSVLLIFSCTAPIEDIPVGSISLDHPSLELQEGETAQLKATVLPKDATDAQVTWSSSNPEIASVDRNGLVTALTPGFVTITASAGQKTATCQVRVSQKQVPVSSITLDKYSLEMVEGERTKITATVLPQNATNATVTWSSSDSSAATVDEEGNVVAVKVGSATITAKAGDKTASCTVKVSSSTIPVSSISLNTSKLSLVEGESAVLTATVLPANATNASVTWSSSHPEIATVSQDGTVTAIKEGNATITAKAEDKTATCSVSVSPATIPVSSIGLDKSRLSLTEGETYQLTASVYPTDATNKEVSWTSSDKSIASVDQDGTVHALKEGTATITAKAEDKTATCMVTVSANVIPVSSISLNKANVTVTEGESFRLVATVLPENATDKTVSWSSSDESLATVDQSGYVRALAAGVVSIMAKAGDKTASCTVTINKLHVDVSSITLNKTTLSLVEGDSETLVATVKPDNASNKTVTWTSSDDSIATVNENGKVTAIKEGYATITAKAEDKTAECQVTVSKMEIPVSSIVLNTNNLEVVEGESVRLIATVNPPNATNASITWSSSSDVVASVDQQGLVTALKEGVAVITAQAGDKTATCRVTVSKNIIAVTSITLNKSTLSLKEGESETLVATVGPDNATDKTVTWSSSNASVATVDQSGRVAALKEGTATITAKAGDKTATCSVTVSKNVVAVTSIALNKTSLSLKEGESETLVATVSPDNATDKTVTWSSSNTSIATVDASGRVTAIKEGTATITATAGDKSATCSVTVSKNVVAVTSIALNKTSLSLKEGESETLVATVSPDNATDKTVTWSSTNTSVATVDASGRVTAIKEGTATITAKAGDKSATCSVTVSKNVVAVTSIALNKTSLSLKEGESETLVATVSPDNATDKTVTWSSTNTSVATVDASGRVTAIKEGTATITAKAGDKSATCAVTVKKKADSGQNENFEFEDWN